MSNQNIETKAKEFLAKSYARQLTPDPGGGYVATISEFPGCIAEGDTADEALENLQNAAQSWLQVAIAHGQDIREPADFGTYSGKIALRIPRSLHQQVAELAQLEGTSINQVFVSAIAHYVGSKRVVHDITQLLELSRPQNNYFILSHGSYTGAALSTTTGPNTYIPGKDMLRRVGEKLTVEVTK